MKASLSTSIASAGSGASERGKDPLGVARGAGGPAPSYRQIWMADGVSVAGPDIFSATADGGGSSEQVSSRPGAE